ncbi:hypothetical protein J1614_004715 [Plenodomus biglobosus]|nr:hypothetical protein J1614_004715 [Plenodomus biglobosus]
MTHTIAFFWGFSWDGECRHCVGDYWQRLTGHGDCSEVLVRTTMWQDLYSVVKCHTILPIRPDIDMPDRHGQESGEGWLPAARSRGLQIWGRDEMHGCWVVSSLVWSGLVWSLVAGRWSLNEGPRHSPLVALPIAWGLQ